MFETLGPYKILERIGAGGLGVVYRGRDAQRGRTVAIEVVPDSASVDADHRAGLVREAQASTVLSHPNIASLYEIGEEQGQLFLVFEFVPGQTLQAAIGAQPMNLRRALDIGVQIADALADAHAHDIFHRSLKPASVIVTPKGKAKVLDFGLAVWIAGEVWRDKAADAVAYMSPEQLRGDLVDERTDIFSLGVVLFEMVTGTIPPAKRRLPREVDAIVAKAIAPDPRERYQSAAALAADLREAAALIEARR
jgi:serine/threonine protein kinase